MLINSDLLEQLLHEDESTSLDFKSAQYAFRGVPDDQKAELLKDVLALANSWRRSDGYILIGVDEVCGGRSRPIGVREHLDDAVLQQFVNSKTQRPMDIAYYRAGVDGVSIGVIHVPVQQRPLYLLKDFGRLRKETVYLRRGSSTAEATPDEIAKMGQATAGADEPPILTFGATEHGSRVIMGLDLEVNVEDLAVPPLPDYGISARGMFYNPMTNRDYLRELAEYVRVMKLTSPLGLMVKNDNGPPALGVEWCSRVKRDDNVVLLTKLPQRPSTYDIVSGSDRLRSLFQEPLVTIDSFSDHWEVRARFGDILPGDGAWLREPLLIGAHVDKEVKFEGQLLASNLRRPLEANLAVKIIATPRALEEKDLNPFLKEDAS